MRIFLALLLALPLLAQEQKEVEKTEVKKTEAPKEEAKPESPAPVEEKPLNLLFDVGARWVGSGGDYQTYRSVNNLGEGIRLIGMEAHYLNPDFKWLDTVHLTASHWGGDPYNTTRFDAGKRGAWRLRANYANLAYFNFLPSFANPGMSSNRVGTQRAYDVQNRTTDVTFEALPGEHLTPYVTYVRNLGFGDGITPLVVDGNEYPLRNLVRWMQNDIAGGLRAEYAKFHATFEAGRTGFRDDQQVISNEKLTGNRLTPVLGAPLFLNEAYQAYGVKTKGPYIRALLNASPFNWLDITGMYMRTGQKTFGSYAQSASGSLVELAMLRLYDRQQDNYLGDIEHPRSSGQVAAEIRPISRVRIQQTFMTDRFTQVGGGDLKMALYTGNAKVDVVKSLASTMHYNYNRWQVEALVEVNRRLTIRGGHRTEFGDALLRGAQLNQFKTEEASLKRQVGMAGFNARPISSLVWTGDFEMSNGSKTWFRTSVQDYNRIRNQVRWNPKSSLSVTGNWSQFENRNPSPAINLKFMNRQAAAAVQWMPNDGKRFTLLTDYTRATIKSELGFLDPLNFQSLLAKYRDNAHVGTALLDLNLGQVAGSPLKITAGGTFVTGAGSRPMRYYQPIGRVLMPVHKRMQLYSEWRWYGFTQPFYVFEGFRSHQILTGLRLTM
jgi:hypothetical protein